MKERPILFSAPMVRALLDGKKTQTRRVVKPRPEYDTDCPYHIGLGEDRKARICPYGQLGDRLWVRETWSGQKDRPLYAGQIFYRADGEVAGKQTALSYFEREKRWRPAIHMPRHLSRILLEVIGVRIERLREINDADAAAEGWPGPGVVTLMPRTWYAGLWESINGASSWAADPWVWVISFRCLPLPGNTEHGR